MMEILGALVSLIAATAFVLGLAYVCLKLLKRFQPGFGAAEGVDFMRSVPVGPRERVTLMRYRGEIFMLGVASGSVRLLARFPDDGRDPPLKAGNLPGNRENPS